MCKIAFVFPGQGAQYIGMGKSFYDEFKEAKLTFEEASDSVGLNMMDLCFEENKELHMTEYTQPAIITATVAILKTIKAQYDIKPEVVAGLSLGEYSALVANEALTFYEAVNTVRQRGKYMQEAVPIGMGAMAAILGLDIDSVESVCETIEDVEIANYNCPGQIVISGRVEAVDKAIELLNLKGAKRALKLKVSGPFHSSLLQPASEALAKVLEGIDIQTPVIPYISNVTADYVMAKEAIKPLLIRQVATSVKWQQSIERMIEDGIKTFIEIGPSKTLSSFIKKINRKKKVINIETVDDLKKLEGGIIC